MMLIIAAVAAQPRADAGCNTNNMRAAQMLRAHISRAKKAKQQAQSAPNIFRKLNTLEEDKAKEEEALAVYRERLRCAQVAAYKAKEACKEMLLPDVRRSEEGGVYNALRNQVLATEKATVQAIEAIKANKTRKVHMITAKEMADDDDMDVMFGDDDEDTLKKRGCEVSTAFKALMKAAKAIPEEAGVCTCKTLMERVSATEKTTRVYIRAIKAKSLLKVQKVDAEMANAEAFTAHMVLMSA